MAFWRKTPIENVRIDLATLKKKAQQYSALAQAFASLGLNSFALPVADDFDRFYDFYWPYANIKAEFELVMSDVEMIKY